MTILMLSVPKQIIRSNQVGDWTYGQELLVASADNSLNEDSQFAVMIHEIIECYLCRKRGITDQQVCAFDNLFEKERLIGKHKEDEENGDDPRAPYRKEHQAATFVERAVCHALGLKWDEHCGTISELPKSEPKSAEDRL